MRWMLQPIDHSSSTAACAIADSIYHSLLHSIASKDLCAGRRAEQRAIQHGLQTSNFLATHFIRMFTLCNSVAEADPVFARLPTPNVYAWSAFLLAHSDSGLSLRLYRRMRQSGVQPNAYCYTALLKACGSLGCLDNGTSVHDHVVQDGFDTDATVNNTLIDMYVKVGNLAHAHALFEASSSHNVVAWTTLIAGYSSVGNSTEAFALYERMIQRCVSPNAVTFASIMKACSNAVRGRLLHFHVLEIGLDCNLFVGNALVDMYAELGSIEEARFVFEHLHSRDVVTWSSIIEGYAQDQQANEALLLFSKMQEEVGPNKVTFMNLAKVCTISESSTLSNLIYGSVTEEGFDSDTRLGTALVDMYTKCGCFEDADVLFRSLPVRNVVTWTTMICGYASHGDINVAMKYYVDMQGEGLRPNEVTFLSLLSAYNHLGLVHEGCTLFDTMTLQGVTPTNEHHHCMMDLFGRTGCLDLASVVSHSVPVDSLHSIGWPSILSHCKTHGSMNMSKPVLDSLERIIGQAQKPFSVCG